MAELNTTGLEELSDAFMRHEQAADETVEAMLKAEADEYVKAFKQSAAGYNIRDTGGFIESIKAGNVISSATEKSIDIVPEGRTNHNADYGGGYSNMSNKRKGKAQKGKVRYATIGYIFEYGSSSIPARPWHTQGLAKAEQPAYKKAQEIWEKYVNSTMS